MPKSALTKLEKFLLAMGIAGYLVLASIIMVLFTGCATEKVDAPQPAPVEIPIKLWATWYNMPTFKSVANGIPVRDKRGVAIGPKLSNKDWCNMAMEGSGIIGNRAYNYAGVSDAYKVTCNYAPSGRVKFYSSSEIRATGSRDNFLIDYVSVACDQNVFKFGQKFFIPSAKGVKLPNGKTHDGLFICHDMGGKIKGIHIDVFIGQQTRNFFTFIKSTSSGQFDAYLRD